MNNHGLTFNTIVLMLDSGEQAAKQARLAALIKLKSFDLALELIAKNKKAYIFEHAYVLHRQGKNKEALKII